METVVALDRVSRSFHRGEEEVRALVELSLELAPGEMVALVGPSGCGKSTALNLVAAVDRPDSGSVRVCGVDVSVASEEELVNLMGPVDTSLVKERGATSIMLVGLQGVGKTTIAAKLASHLKRQGRRPLLVAADIYRRRHADPGGRGRHQRNRRDRRRLRYQPGPGPEHPRPRRVRRRPVRAGHTILALRRA